jgi:hypothetical protein
LFASKIAGNILGIALEHIYTSDQKNKLAGMQCNENYNVVDPSEAIWQGTECIANQKDFSNLYNKLFLWMTSKASGKYCFG